MQSGLLTQQNWANKGSSSNVIRISNLTKIGLEKATSQFQGNWFNEIKGEAIVFMQKC